MKQWGGGTEFYNQLGMLADFDTTLQTEEFKQQYIKKTLG